MPRERREKKKFNDRDDRGRMRRKKRRPCVFCADKFVADYKNIEFMRKFITDRGKIAPRRISGCCAKHQRLVAIEVKKARQIGLLPFTVE